MCGARLEIRIEWKSGPVASQSGLRALYGGRTQGILLTQDDTTEAEAVLAKIAVFQVPLDHSKHSWERLSRRRFYVHDLMKIVRSHQIEGAPIWDEDCQNFNVCRSGTDFQGRPTLIVLGLRHEGPCSVISVMIDRRKDRTRRSK